MQLLAPDILAETCGLSQGVLYLTLAVGIALLVTGWMWHRFWVVLLATVGAGIYGLCEGPTFQTSPLVAGLLFAIAAGMLALALVRLLAFVAGGLMGVAVTQTLFPQFQQHVVSFLIAGMIALVLFRPFMMALTSFMGSLLVSYAGLTLLNHYGALDANIWTDQKPGILSAICLGLTFLGCIAQFTLDRTEGEKKKKDKDKEKEKKKEPELEDLIPALVAKIQKKRAG